MATNMWKCDAWDCETNPIFPSEDRKNGEDNSTCPDCGSADVFPFREYVCLDCGVIEGDVFFFGTERWVDSQFEEREIGISTDIDWIDFPGVTPSCGTVLDDKDKWCPCTEVTQIV